MMIAPNWASVVSRALAEDRATDDITTGLLGTAAKQIAAGRLVAQEHVIVAGLPGAAEAFAQLDPAVEFAALVDEGAVAESGVVLATVRGPARVLLAGERTALNLVQHLSGVATATRRAVDAVGGTGAVIADTRKTTPGLRDVEKYAVRVGGGVNHRSDLAEAVFLKDNHWALLRKSGQDLAALLASVPPDTKVVVEVDDAAEFETALQAGARHIMADNQAPAIVRSWVSRAGDDVTVEASGGITLANVRDYADAGARVISMGSLTHSVRAAEIGFEIESDATFE